MIPGGHVGCERPPRCWDEAGVRRRFAACRSGSCAGGEAVARTGREDYDVGKQPVQRAPLDRGTEHIRQTTLEELVHGMSLGAVDLSLWGGAAAGGGRGWCGPGRRGVEAVGRRQCDGPVGQWCEGAARRRRCVGQAGGSVVTTLPFCVGCLPPAPSTRPLATQQARPLGERADATGGSGGAPSQKSRSSHCTRRRRRGSRPVSPSLAAQTGCRGRRGCAGRARTGGRAIARAHCSCAALGLTQTQR